MLTMNSKMLKEYTGLSLANIDLNHDLREIAASGFKCKDGCFFLKKCIEIDTNASSSDFSDKTGYECFINSINIDDYVKGSYLEQGLCFVQHVFVKWNESLGDHKLIAILSLDEFGLKVKFHMLRNGEQWLTDELEDYEESILVMDSSEPDINIAAR